jgi:hypothetical protein
VLNLSVSGCDSAKNATFSTICARCLNNCARRLNNCARHLNNCARRLNNCARHLNNCARRLIVNFLVSVILHFLLPEHQSLAVNIMEPQRENPDLQMECPPLSQRNDSFGAPATLSSDGSDSEIRAMLSSEPESESGKYILCSMRSLN